MTVLILDSAQWISDSRYWISDSFSVELVSFWILKPRIPDSTSTNFPKFRIPLHGMNFANMCELAYFFGWLAYLFGSLLQSISEKITN